MATIEKRGDMWYSVFQHHGQRYHDPLDKNEARAWTKLRELVAVVKSGEQRYATSAGWKEFKAEYFRVNEHNKHQRTLQTEKTAIKQLEDFTPISKTDDVTPELLEDFKIERKKKGCGAPGINRIVRAIKVIMRWAARRKLSTSKDWGMVSYLPEPKGTTDFFTLDEYQRLLDVAQKSVLHYTLAILAGRLGLRASEAYWLRWENVDLHLGRVLIYAKEDFVPKGNKTRFVPLPSDVHAYLKKLKARSKSEYVISESYGWRPASPEAMGTEFKKQVLKPAGLRKRLHILRHTFASHFLRNRGQLKSLQELMGHSRQSTTERYTHFAPHELDQDMKTFSPKMKKPLVLPKG